jgi:cyclase
MQGYDVALIRAVCEAVSVPVIACGGAGRLEDFVAAVRDGGASAVAAGSLFVFHGKHRAVLVSYPEYRDLERLLGLAG